jgi:hypothetical protein
MRVKVRGGTVQHGQPSLCLTCRSATIVKGSRLRDDILECGRIESRITFAVTDCNCYINATHPTVREMEDVAWVLRSDPRRNQIGFVAPGKLKAHERYVFGRRSSDIILT